MATALTGKAVWSTAAINDLPDASFLYIESGGEKDGDGKTTPRSLRHFPYKDASGKVDLPHLRNAISRIPQSNAPGLNKSALQARAQKLLASHGGGSSDSEKAGRRMQGGMLQKLRDVVRWAAYDDGEEEGMEEEDEEEEEEEEMTKSFMVFKAEDGSYRWVAVSSSAFVDREGEIVSTKALVDDVARADQSGQRGPLLLWHTPGTEIGDCDFQAVEGRLLVESGTFRETDFAVTVRKALQRSDEELGVSIGFRHTLDQPDADGVFHRIVIHERSVCPLEVAANPFTSFETIKESVVDEKRKAWFTSLVGPSHADRIVGVASAKSKELEGLYSFKALDALKATAEPEEPPEEPPDDGDDGDEGGDDEKALALKAGEFFEAIAETVNEALSPAVEAVKAQDVLLSAMVEEIKSLRSRIDALETEAETEKAETPPASRTKAARAREALKARPTESDGNIIDSDIVRDMFKASGREPEPPKDDNPVRPYIDDIFNGALGRGA